MPYVHQSAVLVSAVDGVALLEHVRELAEEHRDWDHYMVRVLQRLADQLSTGDKPIPSDAPPVVSDALGKVLKSYRDGLAVGFVAGGGCPHCEDDGDLCNYDYETGLCDESRKQIEVPTE